MTYMRSSATLANARSLTLDMLRWDLSSQTDYLLSTNSSFGASSGGSLCCPCHSVQCTSVLEPRNLALIESVIQFCLPYRTVFGVHSEGQRPTDGQLGAHDVYLVIRIDFVIVGGVSKSERQEPLLLKVCFML